MVKLMRAPIPTGRLNAAVAVVNDLLYVVGGETPWIGQNTDASAVNELYVPVGYEGPVEPSLSPSPTASPHSTEPEPFPTTLVATASGTSVVIIGIGLLMYFRRRNH